MADKYIDTSLSTGLNDGTSKENAWQSYIEVVTNTMASGSIAAGDIPHVRTHDGTNNCTEAMTADVTMAVPTDVANPTTFVFDDGTVWSGDAGIFILDATVSHYAFTFLNYVNFDCDGTNYRFELYSAYAVAAAVLMATIKINTINGLHINTPFSSGYNFCKVEACTLINFKATLSTIRSTYYYFSAGVDTATKFINLIIEFLDPSVGPYTIFTSGIDGSTYEIVGGKLLGYVSEIDTFLLSSSGGDANLSKFIDFHHGLIAGIFRLLSTAETRESSKVVILGGNNPFDFHEESLSKVEVKQGENYPYLNSTFPNPTSEGWSYKVSPWGANKGFQYSLPPIVKAFNQSSAIQTLTLEFLLSTSFTNINTDVLSASFFYIDDATGLQKSISTFKAGGTVAISTAPWSNTSYGAKSYNKYKIEVTTPTSIKQGTKVTARVVSGIPEVAVDDFWFMDSDITIS